MDARLAPVRFRSGKHRLAGVLYWPGGARPRPAAILLHGLPGLEKNADLASALQGRGIAALIVHYRGCWGSEGRFSFEGAVQDIRAAVGYAAGRKEFSKGRIAVVGFCLGASLALEAAISDPRIKAVVSIGSHADIRMFDRKLLRLMARESVRLVRAKPLAFLLRELRGSPPWTAPQEVVHRLSPRPLLILHGSKDADVPPDHARRLYACARPPKALKIIKGTDHYFIAHRARLIRSVCSWLGKRL